MKKGFLIISLMYCLNFYTQVSTNNTVSNDQQFVPISSYKEMKKESSMKIDSLGFVVYKNDTLIRVKGLPVIEGVKVVYEPKDSIFLKRYESIVYNTIYGKKEDIKKARMRYWKDEIKVYLDSTLSSKAKREMKKLFNFLDKEIDSLKISIVNNRKKANYFIYFINNPSDIDWETRMNNKSDGGYISWNGKSQIYNATIKVNTQLIFNEKEQLMLLKKHFIWSLGFFYLENNTNCKSFFSNCVYVDKDITKEDLEILKYHYSYGICKGTDLETFEKNHKDAKAMLKKDPKNKYYFIHQL